MNLAQPQALKLCGKCNEKLLGFTTECNGIPYHSQCFQCDKCHQPLANSGVFVRIGVNMYCRPCRNAMMPKQGYSKELPQPKSNTLSSVSSNSQHITDLTLDRHKQPNTFTQPRTEFSQPTAFTLTNDDLIHQISPRNGNTSFGGLPTENNTLNVGVSLSLHNTEPQNTIAQATTPIITNDEKKTNDTDDNEVHLPSPPPPVHNKSFGVFDTERIPNSGLARAHSYSVNNVPPNQTTQNHYSADNVRHTVAVPNTNNNTDINDAEEKDMNKHDQQQQQMHRKPAIQMYDASDMNQPTQNINNEQLPHITDISDTINYGQNTLLDMAQSETSWTSPHLVGTEKILIDNDESTVYSTEDTFIPPPPLVMEKAEPSHPMHAETHKNDTDAFIRSPPFIPPPPPTQFCRPEYDELLHQISPRSGNKSFGGFPTQNISMSRTHSYSTNSTFYHNKPQNTITQTTTSIIKNDNEMILPNPPHVQIDRNENQNVDIPPPPPPTASHEEFHDELDYKDREALTVTKPRTDQEEHKKTNKQIEEPMKQKEEQMKQNINIYEEVYEASTDPKNIYHNPEPVKKKKKKKFKLFG